MKGKHEALSLLLKANSEHINDRNKVGSTPLTLAANHGHNVCVELLINYHADLNIQGHHKRTALMYATVFNHLNCVRLLLQHNANKNLKDNLGRTAYHYAQNEEMKALFGEHL